MGQTIETRTQPKVSAQFKTKAAAESSLENKKERPLNEQCQPRKQQPPKHLYSSSSDQQTRDRDRVPKTILYQV